MPKHDLKTALERNHRILLVDDNPAIHEDYRKIIGASANGGAGSEIAALEAEIFGDAPQGDAQQKTYEVVSAYQGQEALELVRAARARGEPFAMAFMDVRMPPGWNGVETTQRIWREDPDLEVVICTAYSDCGWSDIVEQLGETDRLLILKKPFDAMEVQQLAHALTEKWYLRRKAELTLQEVQRHLDEETMRRKHIEAELRHAQKLEAIGRLASGLAHELNTPLQFSGDNVSFLSDGANSLTGLIETYRRALASANLPLDVAREIQEAERAADVEFLTEQMPQAVDDLTQGLRRVSTIVKALRSFSSVGQPGRGYVDLNGALRDTLVVAQRDFKEVEVETDLHPLPLVHCRPADLNQVFLTILTNAAQAMADRPGVRHRLRVVTKPDGGDHVTVEISDTGVGIADDVRDHVFEPFFTTRDVGKGAGLGLSVAHGIVVKGHGGTISFETKVGAGTTFRVRLPLKPAQLADEVVPLFEEKVA